MASDRSLRQGHIGPVQWGTASNLDISGPPVSELA
jgi:hypothetical protein